ARAVRQANFLRAQTHRAAELGVFAALLDRALLILPLRDQRDHGMRRRTVELGRVGALEAGHVARVLDDRELHAEADAEIGNLPFARVPDRRDLAVDAALAEAARDENRVRAFQAPRPMLLDVGRFDELNVDA